MAEPKTKPSNASVEEFLNTITPEQKRNDCFALLEIFKHITVETPVMWGANIVGFGRYQIKPPKGNATTEWPLIGFAPRKQNLTLYLMNGFEQSHDLLKKLGKHKTSVNCLYINKLSDVDKKILEQLIQQSYQGMLKIHKA